tara:strand:- start:91207 stop:93123 length:1917 start_codon:yes stop_codon:yes gene_type:complete
MFDALSSLFDTQDFPARWHCGSWTELHGWTHIIADAAIFLAYFAIPCVLLYSVKRLGKIPSPFPKLVFLFAAFIVLCGVTHLNEAIIFWHPHYRLAAVFKVCTAIISLGTVAALIPAIPKFALLRTPAQLESEVLLATDALRKERDLARRFAILVDSSHDAIICVDPLGIVQSWNRRASQLFRHDSAEVIGTSLALYIPETFNRVMEVIKAEGNVKIPHTKIQDNVQGGAEISLAIAPVLDAERKLIAVSITARDISDQQMLKRLTLRAEGLFRVAVEASPSSMIATDQEGKIVLLNAETEKLFGYTREELIGQPIEKLVPIGRREDHPQLREDYGKAPETRSMHDKRELFALRKGGEVFPVEIGLNPVETADGPITLCAIVDRTEALAKQESLESAMAALQERTNSLALSNKELEQFAYVTSHDLKAPLRGMQNAAKWIEEDLPKELVTADMRENLELLMTRAARMESMIDGLLMYSRANQLGNEIHEIDTGALVRDIVEMSGLVDEVTVEVSDDLPTIVSPKIPLEHIFANLISNAQKHRDGKPIVVTISCEDLGSMVAFTVEDNGPGIEDYLLEKVFQIFQTGKARDDFESTGIGLAIVKKLVENYGGEIILTSEVGSGAAFRFTWPKHAVPIEN